jgi:signal transduction histidine kinase
MIKRLRKRFIRISTVAVASVMALLCVAVNVAYCISVDAQLRETIDMIADNRGRMPEFRKERLPDEMQDEGRRPMGRRFNEETPFSTRYFVLYYTEDGALIRSDLEKIAAVSESDVQQFLSVALQKGEGYAFTSGYKLKIVRQPDGITMAVFLNAYEQWNDAKTVLVVSACATAFCIALICVLIVLFSKKAMEPVLESDRRQKQFITDASHELKTPITVIRTCMTVLEMEVGSQKWIDKAKAQTDKLKELVESLVTLSKMNEGEQALHMTDFDVSGAAQETAESFADFAAENGHELNIQIEPELRYHGDEYAVRQLVSILLDNAVKYATDGTPISFSLEKEKKGVVIRTKNMCDDVQPDALDKLFDRFYRADPSRSNEKSGFGVGLSIARGICEAHKGSIRAVSEDGRTIEFQAVLK